jgi:hypothetical protein
MELEVPNEMTDRPFLTPPSSALPSGLGIPSWLWSRHLLHHQRKVFPGLEVVTIETMCQSSFQFFSHTSSQAYDLGI